MANVQILPITAASHHKVRADFWENEALLLRDKLIKAEMEVERLTEEETRLREELYALAQKSDTDDEYVPPEANTGDQKVD